MRAYFRKTVHYTTFRFVVELTSAAFLFNVIAILVYRNLLVDFFHLHWLNVGWEDPHQIREWNYTVLLLWGCAGFPLIMTIFTQWLPVRLLNKLTDNPDLVVGGSALFFTWVFAGSDLQFAIFTFPLGVALGWSFLLYRRRSFAAAVRTTFFIHALHNLVVVSVLILNDMVQGVL